MRSNIIVKKKLCTQKPTPQMVFPVVFYKYLYAYISNYIAT